MCVFVLNRIANFKYWSVCEQGLEWRRKLVIETTQKAEMIEGFNFKDENKVL